MCIYAQGGCGCPIPGGIQGHSGCGSGQPGLEVGNPAHSRGGRNLMITVVLFNPGHYMILHINIPILFKYMVGSCKQVEEGRVQFGSFLTLYARWTLGYFVALVALDWLCRYQKMYQKNHRIIGSSRLEKTSKFIQSNHLSTTNISPLNHVTQYNI